MSDSGEAFSQRDDGVTVAFEGVAFVVGEGEASPRLFAAAYRAAQDGLLVDKYVDGAHVAGEVVPRSLELSRRRLGVVLDLTDRFGRVAASSAGQRRRHCAVQRPPVGWVCPLWS